MKLLLRGHDDRYALEQLQLQLFPEAPMEATEQPFSGCDGAVSTLYRGNTYLTAVTEITVCGKTARKALRLRKDRETVRLRRRLLQQSYYLCALQLLGQAPPWGALSGVRPSKLTTKCLLEGGSPRDADKLLKDVDFISEARRTLCIDASRATVQAVSRLEKRDVSIYVGIPFCPTRCAYCSFVSQSIERYADLLEPYLSALCQEIEAVGQLLRDTGRRVRTLYIGGGTPTTLSAAQMKRLQDALRAHLDLTSLIEYTVEGGRPDTLTEEKLRGIRESGSDRMSINPQTMNDTVLRAIGRRHTTQETVDAFWEARKAGFSVINMDLIAGLPEDTEASFADSLSQVLALAPENITVHTLSLKKGADLFWNHGTLPTQAQVSNMLDGAQRRLRAAGYVPYYLYKQKYMSGSFENVGWCLPGTEGLYNIYMMEEVHTILSLGGGGMTKINLPNGKLERFHNPKYPKEYLERISSVLEQKKALSALLMKEEADVD